MVHHVADGDNAVRLAVGEDREMAVAAAVHLCRAELRVSVLAMVSGLGGGRQQLTKAELPSTIAQGKQ
jgi:hypothetical protein